MKRSMICLAAVAVLAMPVLAAAPAQATWDLPRWAGGERDLRVGVGVTTRQAHFDRRVHRRGPAVRFGATVGPRYRYVPRAYSRYYYDPYAYSGYYRYPYGYTAYPYGHYGYYPQRGGISLHFGF